MNEQQKAIAQKRGDWAYAYMRAWDELVKGAQDVEGTLDDATQLWLTQGNRDPAEVAKEDFDRLQ